MTSKTEIIQLLGEYQSIKALEKEVADKLSDLKSQIIEYMDNNKSTEAVIDNYCVTLSDVTKFSWDNDQLKSLLGDELDQFRSSYSYKVLRVR